MSGTETTTEVGEASAARGLLDREQLLQLLDRAVTKRVTVISAPPGSGKTSLLRAWAERSADGPRIAFVSVEREQENAQRFWSAVLDAIRGSTGPPTIRHTPRRPQCSTGTHWLRWFGWRWPSKRSPWF